MYRLIDYGSMLRDHRRVDAYRRALGSVITPSTIVLDLGTGLGTFSILACKLGAARVYAVDHGDVIGVAEENARANRVAERIRFIRARATETSLPENVDVIVSDLAGALPLFEEHIPSLIHMRDRFLAPGGVLIPERDRLFCAPVSSAEAYAQIVEPWRSVPEIDLGPAATMALHTPHALAIRPEDLAAEPQCWGEIDYANVRSPNVNATIEWRIAPATVIHGIALWFECTLHGEIGFASGPWSGDSLHSTMVLPLPEPLGMRDGETLQLTLDATLVAGRYVVTWNVEGRQSFLSGQPTDTIACRPFRIPEHVLGHRVGEELLLLDQSSGVYHILNPTGARVWELLERGADMEAIAAAVASDYDVDPARAAEDVHAIVAQLRRAKLIEAS